MRSAAVAPSEPADWSRLIHFPQAAGARSARLPTRHTARRAVARSGPAVRSRLIHFPQAAGARSARLPTRHTARRAVARSGPAVREGGEGTAPQSPVFIPSPREGWVRRGRTGRCVALCVAISRRIPHLPPGARRRRGGASTGACGSRARARPGRGRSRRRREPGCARARARYRGGACGRRRCPCPSPRARRVARSGP